jgi:hypothetical protein
MRRMAVRLEEGFRLEKDEVLADGSGDALKQFRERCRTIYQAEITMVRNEALKARIALVPGEEWFEEGMAACNQIISRIDGDLARFTGTPNRLIRHAGVIARLATDCRTNVSRHERRVSPEPSLEDLIRTDPPVECPVCGTWLLSDRKFTMLVCPGCGAGESLEIEFPEQGKQPPEEPSEPEDVGG